MEIKNIATALINAQLELKNTVKDTQGYGYKYTELSNLLEQVKPILAKHKLAIIQLPVDNGNGRVGVKTMLVHDSGESLETTLMLPIPEMKGTTATQAAGAAITYARRYSVSAMLNISSDEDTDASTGKQQVSNASVANKTKTATVTGVNKGFNASEKASEKQVKMIYALAKQKGSDIEDIKAYYKLTSLNDITKGTASEVIAKLNAKPDYSEEVTAEDLREII